MHLLVYSINLNITLMQRYEHINVLFFHSSLPFIVVCIVVLCDRNFLHTSICTCIVFQGLLYIPVSADIAETICFYQGKALVLTPIRLTPHGTMSRFNQCLQLKGPVHILPGTVHVWGLCAACAETTPSPCSFTLWDVFSGQITLCIIMLTLNLSLSLCSYLWPLPAPPTSATLKVLWLTCIENVPTVVRLYYSRALLD